MTSAGPVGIGDKLLMGKSVRAALPSTRPVDSGIYKYNLQRTTVASTGPVGSGTQYVYCLAT